MRCVLRLWCASDDITGYFNLIVDLSAFSFCLTSRPRHGSIGTYVYTISWTI